MPQETCWTLIRGAAQGAARAREDFAIRYAQSVRAYFGERWRGARLAGEVDDAAQEVFVECLRDGGALAKAREGEGVGFRAFLFGVAVNVAMRFERNAARARERGAAVGEDAILREAAREEGASRAFDKAWAREILREAAERHRQWARQEGEGAAKRVELLRLRFQEDIPIREIASNWGIDAELLHREFAKAREEFRRALEEIVVFHMPEPGGKVDRECERILEALGRRS